MNFLVRHEPRYRNFVGSLRVLLSARVRGIVGWTTLLDRREMRLQHPRRPRMIVASIIFHISLFIFVLRFPWSMLFAPPVPTQLPLFNNSAVIFYPTPKQKVEIHSHPKSAAKGQHQQAKAAPSAGSARAAGSGVKKPEPTPQFMLVLKPPHPDNNQQTIIQASEAPEIRIKHNVPLPNVLLSGIAQNQPKMPVTGSSPKAVVNPTMGKLAMNVPAPEIPNVAMAVQVPDQQAPLLAEPEVALPLPANQQSLGSIYAAKQQNSASKSARGLLVLSANPVPPDALMKIPPGNRYGEFSVSLLGAKSGVPSGPGGPTMGGGGSTSVRAMKAAGAGAGSAAVKISGSVESAGNGAAAMAAFGPTTSGSGSAEGMLPPWMAANLVYPVKRAPKIPDIDLVVAAGPVGGGGLGAFGVLNCSNIYTIYLQMPGKPWVLQYCKKQTGAKEAAAPTGGSVRMGAGLSPPWPLQQFDFHRPPIDPYKRDNMIVLEGVIDKDGSVQSVKLYEGVGSVADQAAVAAFSKWKFHPATGSNGKAVPVEMLVGIPATP